MKAKPVLLKRKNKKGGVIAQYCHFLINIVGPIVMTTTKMDAQYGISQLRGSNVGVNVGVTSQPWNDITTDSDKALNAIWCFGEATC